MQFAERYFSFCRQNGEKKSGTVIPLHRVFPSREQKNIVSKFFLELDHGWIRENDHVHHYFSCIQLLHCTLIPLLPFPPNQDGNFPTSSSEEFFSPSNFWAGVIRFGCFCPCVGLQQEAKNHPRKNHSYIRLANLYLLKYIFTNFSYFQGFPFIIRQAPKLFRHLTSSSFPSYTCVAN